MWSASPTMSITILTSVAITRYTGPATKQPAVQRTRPVRHRPRPRRGQELHRASGRTEWHRLQGESSHRPSDPRVLQPRRFACPVATGRMRDPARKVYLCQSAGYQRWATIENLKRAAATMNFLTEYGIRSYEELAKQCDAVATSSIRARESLRDTEQRIVDLSLPRR